MVDWSTGYSARYYLTVVDWATMKDLGRIEITGGSIKRSLTELRESADVDCVNYDNTKEQLIRIWLDTRQDGEFSHTALFTGLACCPQDQYSGRIKTNSLECYSVLKIAQDVMLPRGWYAPIEANSGSILKDLLSIVKVPIMVAENAPDLQQSIIAEENETRLSMADKILSSMGNWRLRLDGYGTIYIEPTTRQEVMVFDANSNDVIETDISISYDWYSAPNVLRCSLDDSYAEAKDEDPDSPLSIQNRGREVWLADTNVQLSTNETLGEYAIRMLRYYQQTATTVSYTRRFNPEVYPSDIVRISYPAQGVNGLFMVTDQSIELGYNARTSEEVTKI